MFIRRTRTSNAKTGEAYFTYRLVEAVREGKTVRQRTLLNLGSQFDVPQADWAALATRISQLLHGQHALMTAKPEIEALAQRYAAQIIGRQAPQPEAAGAPLEPAERFHDVDLGTLELVRPRTVGVEHAALTTLRDLGFEEKLAELGLNRPQAATVRWSRSDSCSMSPAFPDAAAFSPAMSAKPSRSKPCSGSSAPPPAPPS